jgi:replicative DNA helicase
MNVTKEMPNAYEVEAALLSSILLTPDSLYNCIQILNYNCFYHKKNQLIWNAIIYIHSNGGVIDMVNVFNYLKSNNQIEQIGGIDAIMNLTTNHHTADVSGYAKILYQKYMRRKAIEESQKLIQKAYNESNDIFDVLTNTKESLFNVLSPDVSRVNTADNIINNNLNHIKENLGKYQEVPGLPTGYENFDRRVGGVGAGWLMIIGGRPSMGKTTFVLNVAWNAYKLFDKSGIFFSGEMSSQQISHLIMATESGIPANEIKKNKVSKLQLECMFDTFRKQQKGVFLIDDTPNPALTHILAEATKAKMQHDIDFVIVDYLQLVKASGHASRHLEVGKISRELKALARNLNIPVIALAQLSRAVENRPNKRPQLSDLKESGDMEQDADVVSFLYRPEYYGTTQDDDGRSLVGITELITKKNRHGETGTDLLYMNKSTSSFEMFDEDGQKAIPVESYDKRLTEMQDTNLESIKDKILDFEGDALPF